MAIHFYTLKFFLMHWTIVFMQFIIWYPIRCKLVAIWPSKKIPQLRNVMNGQDLNDSCDWLSLGNCWHLVKFTIPHLDSFFQNTPQCNGFIPDSGLFLHWNHTIYSHTPLIQISNNRISALSGLQVTFTFCLV